MKKRTAVLLLLLLLLPVLALAEDAQARIEELEARVAALEKENARLRAAIAETAPTHVDRERYSFGEPWVVEGQWCLTLDAVEAVEDRNPFSNIEPEAVYLVTYTYINLGFEDEYMDGLYISLDLGSIVDAEGEKGYMYPGDVRKYPQETAVGGKCTAQVCIGVDHAGSFEIHYTKYVDGTEEKAVFAVTLP